MTRILPATLTAAAAIALLTACGTTTSEPTAPSHTATSHTPAPKPAHTTSADQAEGDTATPSLDPHKLTELAIGLTWDSTSTSDQNSMCMGIATFGTHWAAQQLQSQASDDHGIDWDYAAQLLRDKCDQR